MGVTVALGNYGVHTSRITPLNPPLERGETGNPVPSLMHRGKLGWGAMTVGIITNYADMIYSTSGSYEVHPKS
jgi:hypothetical protein